MPPLGPTIMASHFLLLDLMEPGTRGVSQCGLAIYIKKDLKAKEELCRTQIFHHAKI